LQRYQQLEKKTIGFGTVEQGPNERSEDIQQYNIVTNINLGNCFRKMGYQSTINYVVKKLSRLQYDPFNQDIRIKAIIRKHN
jgi:cell surface protein SprA